MPLRDPEKAQPHRGVFVHVSACQPLRCLFDLQPEFLADFAANRLQWCFAGLNLAAGKLPIAGVNLANRPLGEKVTSIRPRQYGSYDFHDRLVHVIVAARIEFSGRTCAGCAA